MNNLTFGNARFTYYETIGGGQGGCPNGDGPSAVHVAMSNTLNTPVEALELAYPLRVRALRAPARLGRRRAASGAATASSGRSRRSSRAASRSSASGGRTRPGGAAGGEPGAPGRNLLNGDELPGKVTLLARGRRRP